MIGIIEFQDPFVGHRNIFMGPLTFSKTFSKKHSKKRKNIYEFQNKIQYFSSVISHNKKKKEKEKINKLHESEN